MWISATITVVVGALVGGALTFLTQSHMAKQSRVEARRDRLRTEFLEACAAFSGALIAYRHSQLARQKHRLGVRGGDTAELREEVRMRRGDAWTARLRVELLTQDTSVIDAAERSMDAIKELKTVKDPAQLDKAAKRARRSISMFVRCARRHLENPVSSAEQSSSMSDASGVDPEAMRRGSPKHFSTENPADSHDQSQ